jgi:hypothetical protein
MAYKIIGNPQQHQHSRCIIERKTADMPQEIRSYPTYIPIQANPQPVPGTITQHVSGVILLGRLFTEAIQFLIG